MDKSELISLKRFVDDRGFLDQIYNLDLPTEVKRFYLVCGQRGLIRGMHFHEKEWKYFYVAKGSMKFVVSPDPVITEKTQTFVLSEKLPVLLKVPPGNYNGSVCLEDNSMLIGISNFSLDESLNDDKRIDPSPFLELFKVKSR